MSSAIFTDIHCHIVPNIDDGSKSANESVSMAGTAVRDGTKSLIATPHQLGANSQVTVAAIRNGVALLQEQLHVESINVTIRPGADIRIDPELPKLLKQGKVLTLADQGKHVLLELPHETYFPIEPLLKVSQKARTCRYSLSSRTEPWHHENPDVMWDVIRSGWPSANNSSKSHWCVWVVLPRDCRTCC